jgi:hypothetical protein
MLPVFSVITDKDRLWVYCTLEGYWVGFWDVSFLCIFVSGSGSIFICIGVVGVISLNSSCYSDTHEPATMDGSRL